MPRSSIVHLLLSIFICCVTSLSLVPEPYHQLSNVTNPLAAPGICTPFRLLYVRPKWRDCAVAIDAESSSRVSGNFHAKGEFDKWQLPVQDEHGTCLVYIEITQSALGEHSSWFEIKTAARKLNDECRKKAVMGGDVSGGVVRVGEHGWIRISLQRSMMGGEVKGE